jgi:tetratricopeptide (TPR) repeat protein
MKSIEIIMESKHKVILRTVAFDSEEMEISDKIYLHDHPEDWCQLGEHYLKNRKLSLAKHAFSYAFRQNRTLLKALKLLGVVYLRQGLIAEANNCFLKLEYLAPGYLEESDLEYEYTMK